MYKRVTRCLQIIIPFRSTYEIVEILHISASIRILFVGFERAIDLKGRFFESIGALHSRGQLKILFFKLFKTDKQKSWKYTVER